MMTAVDEALDRAEREAAAVVLIGRKGRFSRRLRPRRDDGRRRQGARPCHPRRRLPDAPLRAPDAPRRRLLRARARGRRPHPAHRRRPRRARGAFRIGLNEVQLACRPGARHGAGARPPPAGPPHGLHALRQRGRPGGRARGRLRGRALRRGRAPRRGGRARERLAKLPRDAYAKTKMTLREKTVRYVKETLADDMKRLTPPVPAT